jgi:aerobic carbon-monoxide dehydrogenase large subunit
VIKIGDAVPRYEDERLLTGQGAYTDDETDVSNACLIVVRSPVAAATLTSIDTEEAKAAPGVLGVFTREDLDADGIGTFTTAFPFKRPDGQDMHRPSFGLLAKTVVRYVGDPVVAVIAKTRSQAEDAAELVVINYDDEDAVTDGKVALTEQAPQVWPEVPGNLAFVVERGDKTATDDAFSTASHVTALDLQISRVTANAIEPRAAVGSYNQKSGRYSLRTGTQTPHRMRDTFANDILNVSSDQVHLVSPDIGGAFGMKNNPFPEYGLVLWAAKKLGCQVSWRASRIESMQSDFQGRDNHVHAELAMDANGIFVALRARTIGNLGAYLGPLTPHPPTANVGGMIGPYAIQAAHIEITGVHTHTPPTAPYRGAGRPEATYVIERLVDAASVQLGIDPVELRRRNMLTPEQLPHKTPLGMVYDCGDFPALLTKTIQSADWDGFEHRRKKSEAIGLLRGLGLAYSIEIAGGPQGNHMPEMADIRFDADGAVIVRIGSKEMGTGHGTAYRQILGDQLGLDADRIRVLDGDTDIIAEGTGSFGSRTMIAAGTAVTRAGEHIIATGKSIAADALEAAEIDIEFSHGAFRVVGTDRAITLHALARTAGDKLNTRVSEKADGPTYPNGCHICEVEIDPETGVTTLARYVVVDDVGTVINPMIVKGQLHGGIAQGAGQALMEQIVFDADGQLITGSLLDYCMPRADDMPMFDIETYPIPTALNPLGVKGAGEAGTVGALPAVIIAALNALRPLGVKNIEMPLTSERMWRAIRETNQ